MAVGLKNQEEFSEELFISTLFIIKMCLKTTLVNTNSYIKWRLIKEINVDYVEELEKSFFLRVIDVYLLNVL